jgi:phosphoglycerate kinase
MKRGLLITDRTQAARGGSRHGTSETTSNAFGCRLVVLAVTVRGAPNPSSPDRALAGIPTLEDLVPVAGCRVLVRADLNVPLRPTESGGFEVADDFRLQASKATLEWLLDQGAEVVVCSHLGRPKGKVDPHYAMTPVSEALAAIVPGVEVMENLRFDPGEEANDPDFARRLAAGFDFFVNDAFGACHRSHASIVGLPALLPSAAGRLLNREVEALTRVLVNPERPFVAVVGGAKVADKLGVLTSLAERVDHLLLGGAMCFTFLAAVGHEVGASHFEPALLDEAQSLVRSFDEVDLPSDLVALAPDGVLGGSGPQIGEVRHFAADLLPDWQGVDIGPMTCTSFSETIAQASTVLWNGPMGVFEDPRFSGGTLAVAEAIAACPGFTVAAGGETVAALRHFHLEARIGHLSSGGGATLELIEKGDLPGLAALRSSRGVLAD